jgi:hypothetical protein
MLHLTMSRFLNAGQGLLNRGAAKGTFHTPCNGLSSIKDVLRQRPLSLLEHFPIRLNRCPVMAALVAAIHALLSTRKSWMRGTSPRMTVSTFSGNALVISVYHRPIPS